ncbi:MAG: flagellar hook-length control protein FliK [Sulfuricurvum sp.]|nr:flagellar hook-length control protein FliK [Sulfuricurvum sp.]
MVVQSKENKASSSLIELLGGSKKSDNARDSKSNDVFAQLLTSLKDSTKVGKSTAQKANFTAVIDPKKDSSTVPVPTVNTKSVEPKSTDIKPIDTKKLSTKGLAELLIGKEDETKVFPKELVNVLSNDQVHSLISKAKEYLKNAITEKSPELKADEKAIPKTLMGLVELAHKIGIDLTQITLSTVDKDLASPLKELPMPLLTKPLLDFKGPAKEAAPESFKGFEAIVQLLKEAKPEKEEVKLSKDSKKTSDQPLQTLLKGLDKAPDIVIEAPKELPKSLIAAVHTDALSNLLRGNTDGEIHKEKEEIKPLTESGKSHQPLKADSLEVKSKEAVQSMRHFAIDLKEAAENYKPPFTRLTMKLNPQALGEVDVTLIQRGNNVHVTIQSNNAASVAFLAHNATELKAQLAQQGVTNTTMNFMAGSDNQSQNPQQQQQQQNENRFRAYQSLEELQHNTEELSALEIIIPHYA